jgi:hypothetical protein
VPEEIGMSFTPEVSTANEKYFRSADLGVSTANEPPIKVMLLGYIRAFCY